MLEALRELYNLLVTVFFRGGWVLFALVLPWMFYILYVDRIQLRWYKSLENDWVFLRVTVPPENDKSPLTFEHVFNQLHSVHGTRTWQEKYIQGKFQIWFTWEIVSIGGKIGNYVKILGKHRDTLEAAIYSQYPDAEITEAEDYFQHLPPFDPDHGDYDIFAFSMILKKEDAYPIRSYLDFEHSAADTFVDPITGIWEELGKLTEYEMFLVQYVFQPVNDDWKVKGERLVSKLKGEPQKKRGFPVLEWVAGALSDLLESIFNPPSAEGPRQASNQREEYEPPSLMLHRTEGEKEVIAAIERNLSKLGYATKINCLYLAPKEHYNPSPAYTAVIGGFKALGATDLNSLKPDTDKWTKMRPRISQLLEEPFHKFRLSWRKRRFIRRIRDRIFFRGPKPMILNSEEIATILHFPSTEVVVPEIERVPVAKEKAPADLPIVSNFEI